MITVRRVAATVALAVLAGCTGGGSTGPSPAATTSSPASASPVATTAPPGTTSPTAAAPKPAPTDVAACFDGRCEIEVRRSLEIPLDRALGVPDLEISVARGGVLASADGGAIQTGGSAGSTLTLNDSLRIEILSVRGTTARILLSRA